MRAALLAFAVLPLVDPAVAGSAADPGATYVCYGAKQSRGGGAAGTGKSVAVADRFGTGRVALDRPAALCQPSGEPSDVRGAVLEEYDLGKPAGGRVGKTVNAVTRFGRLRLRVATLDSLLVPSAILPGAVSGGASRGVSPAGASLSCYAAHAPRPKGLRPRVVVSDASGVHLVDVGRATRLCTPVDGLARAELVCFATRLAHTRPLRQPPVTRRTMLVGNPFGSDALRVGAARELCVAVLGATAEPPTETSTTSTSTTTSTASPGSSSTTATTAPASAATTTTSGAATSSTITVTSVPPDTLATSTTSTTLPSVGPPVAIHVVPASLTVVAGERPQFTALASDAAGSGTDVTARVVWQSSDESVAVVAGSAGGAFADAVGPGTAMISAVDPDSGVSSADSGGSAELTVTWPLDSLTIAPHAVTKKPGEFEEYTVTAHFSGGTSLNLTQRVLYASSAPTVVETPNTPGRRSRVRAAAEGVATISATDLISGISTTDAGNDAVLRVSSALRYVYVQPNAPWYGPTLFPGETHNLTAIGVYADGSSRNFTQRCRWETDRPDVVLADNPSDNRGRITAVAPGFAYVRCVDDSPGTDAYGAFVYVVGAIAGLEARGDVVPMLRVGETRGMTALGVFHPFEGICCGGRRNLTQGVIWTSRDPAIVSAPNTPGDRSRILAVGGGIARVYATDPVSGFSSNDVEVPVLGALIALEVRTRSFRGVVGLGTTFSFEVRGDFQGGTLRLSSSELVFESSDPAIVAVEGPVLHAVGPGIATITARDVPTGVTSNGVRVTVQGALQSITLDPPSIVRGIGEIESFTAIGHYPPDITGLLTQRLVYSSSDPSVVTATNDANNHSLVRTVGAGTATITATDRDTGVSGSAAITVLPGAIERLTLQPASVRTYPGGSFQFTAIGHYPDGSTLNETQQVTWTSLVPEIAQATNPKGGRSRIDGVTPGTAVVTAAHPSGVSSHDTGDDAVLEVQALTHLTLEPASRTGRVGQTVRFTFLGHYGDGTTVNLTQRATYWADDPAIARAPGEAGDRSAIALLGAGSTTVRAWLDDLVPGLPRSVSATVVVAP